MGVLFSRDKTTSGIAAMLLRIANLPVKKAFGLAPRRATPIRTRYSGEQLREIRAKKGVGRRKGYAVWSMRIPAGVKVYLALLESVHMYPSTNYAEWQRKPRRKARGPAA